MNLDVTVAIPTIPTRRGMLARAIKSVGYQQYPASAIAVSSDTRKEGAAVNRDAALAMVQTPLVAFLDDDDELYPQHLDRLVNTMAETGADLVYPWFVVTGGGTDPFKQFFGVPWDNAAPHQTTITFLCTTKLARSVGGFSEGFELAATDEDARGNRIGEDYRFILRAVAAGAKIVHLPERTWGWNHHANNTSGLPSRW